MNERSELDNPVWHSLTGRLRPFATVVGRAAQLDPDVGPFGAIDEGGWDDLRELIGPGHATVLVSPDGRPDGWSVEATIPGVQLVADVAFDPVELDVEPLDSSHAEEILELIAATQPGPFGRRTVELGGFVGVRDGDGALVAMAGERFQVDGYSEVSGVCTVASQRGRGLGGTLTRLVSHRIQQRGEQAYLHASADNHDAIRLYRNLGFVLRRTVDFVVVRAPT